MKIITRKRTITYVDFNSTTRTETFCFHLSQAETIEFECSESGGITKLIEKIIATQDNVKLVDIFKDLIRRSYGEISPDGRRFCKTDDKGRPLFQQFEETEAYSILFMELATDDKKAAEFIKGIIPEIKVDTPAVPAAAPTIEMTSATK